MTIDFHAHYGDSRDYLDRFLRAMDRAGIDKACLSAFGPHFGWRRGNCDVAAAVRAHPDRVIGFVFVRPGWGAAGDIVRWHGEGMRGLKVTCPRTDYDDPAYHALWARAQELSMPVLFHTGVVTLPSAAPADDISSRRMHPMMLEPISRTFPRLRIVCAHLGIHWNSDAAELLRMRPNVYADITGEPGGYRARLTPGRLREYLWWPGAFDRLVFGTDVEPEKIDGNLRHDRDLLEALQLSRTQIARYFHGNAAELLDPGSACRRGAAATGKEEIASGVA